VNLPVTAAVFSLFARGKDLYCGTTEGVYIFPDKSAQWEDISNGLWLGVTLYSLQLAHSAAGDYLLAGSDGMESGEGNSPSFSERRRRIAPPRRHSLWMACIRIRLPHE